MKTNLLACSNAEYLLLNHVDSVLSVLRMYTFLHFHADKQDLYLRYHGFQASIDQQAQPSTHLVDGISYEILEYALSKVHTSLLAHFD